MDRTYQDRRYILGAIFLFVGIVYLLRLFYIQVVDERYKLDASNNVLRYVTQYPARGLIYDRKGELLVYNEAAYDLMVIPRQIEDIDTLSFCELIGISKEDFVKKMEKAKNYPNSSYKPSVFEKLITSTSYASIAEKLYNYQGFYVQTRTVRKFSEPIAAHIVGYISEVTQDNIKKYPYYKTGDYIGLNGIEKEYEKELRGKKGLKIVMVDVMNREQGSYKKGKYDTLAVVGKNLQLTIDAKIQQYGEQLMQNKIGSIVAIEPSTGEILALVTSPNYDPNLLVGRDRSKNYVKLEKDSLKPLFNRALMAKYPPGSIFKTMQALIALQEQVIFPNSSFACNKSFVGCHNHPDAQNVTQAIKCSCNPYFYSVYKKIIQRDKFSNRFVDALYGYQQWRKQVLSFGLGDKLGIDISGEKGGNIPSDEYYNRIYGKHHWAFSTIYSLSIGQGEIQVVPLQMANLAAILANRGYYYTPHLIKAINVDDTIPSKFTVKHSTTVNSSYYDYIIEGMQAVVNEDGGTARRARIDSITVCGKTGTAQNPHGEDHSVFIAFAPKENPKIAIAVFVENAGFGGTWAAPIASLMMEKYLTDSIAHPEKEIRILETNFIKKE